MTVYTTLVGSTAHSTKQHAIKLQEINLDFQNLKQTVDNLDVEALAEIKQEFEGLNLEDLVTDQELINALSNYSTAQEVSTLLTNYTTTQDMNQIFDNYVLTNDLNNTLANYATTATLSDYATDQEVANLLVNYPTQQMVNDALENYVLTGDLSAALSPINEDIGTLKGQTFNISNDGTQTLIANDVTITGNVIANNITATNIDNITNKYTGNITLPSFIDNGDATLTLSGGSIALTTSPKGDSVYFRMTLPNQTLSFTDGLINYLYATPAGYAVTLQPATFYFDARAVPICRVARDGLTLIVLDYGEYALLGAQKSLLRDVFQGAIKRQTGLILSSSGTRIANCSEGYVWFGNAFKLISSFQSDLVDMDLVEVYPVAGVWTYNHNLTQYDSIYCADATYQNRVPLGSNKYCAKYFFKCIAQNKKIMFYMHGKEYTSQSTAESETIPTPPQCVGDNSLYVGKFVMLQNGTSPLSTILRIWKGPPLQALNGNYESNINTTIEHLTVSDDDLQIGDVVEMSGDIIINDYSEEGFLKFIVNPSETSPYDVCPKIKKCTTQTKKYCGVVTRIYEIGDDLDGLRFQQKCYKFASHGDCMLKVNDSSIYHVGDTVLSDLSILGDDSMITNLKISCTVGKVSKIINQNYLAIFKA